MLVTVEDFAIADSNVGFALATSMTLLKNGKKLKAIKTLELKVRSFQRATKVIY